MYTLVYSEKAQEDLAKLRHSEPAALKKAIKLLNELMEHPMTGTGHPEPLKGNRSGQWRYRIGDYRLICSIEDERLVILALSVGRRSEIYK